MSVCDQVKHAFAPKGADADTASTQYLLGDYWDVDIGALPFDM